MTRERLALHGGGATADPAAWPRWPVYGELERQRLNEALAGPVWGATGMGPKIAELNERWATFCGTRRSVALANGTATLELSLRGLGIGPGDEVIVPAWTFMATASAVLQIGAVPVFVDVDAESLCLSPAATEAALGPRTRAMIPVHFAGHPCDMDALGVLAEGHGLVVIEDAAQAHGAIWRGRMTGSLGRCASFSFQQSKNLQCGEGGAVTTDDEDLADRLHFSLSKFGRGVRERYTAFAHYELAGNESMTEFQAAIALAQLERLEEQTARRSEARRALIGWLREVPGVNALGDGPGVDRHGSHLFVVRFDTDAFAGIGLGALIAALAAEGVPCSAVYPGPLFEQPMYERDTERVRGSGLAIRRTACPVTAAAAAQILAIPQQALLAERDLLRSIPAALEKVQRLACDLVYRPTSSGRPLRADR